MSRPTPAIILSLVLGATFALPTSPALAAGGGGTSTTPECARGKVWSRSKKRCVRVKKSSGLTDDNLFEAARGFAYSGRYADALEVLALVGNADDPRVLNYKGYATRKLGRVEEGLAYYRAALRIDPDYTLVREYMGEAFLTLGQVDKAREQLAEIGKRCGTDCREYGMLDREIQAHSKR